VQCVKQLVAETILLNGFGAYGQLSELRTYFPIIQVPRFHGYQLTTLSPNVFRNQASCFLTSLCVVFSRVNAGDTRRFGMAIMEFVQRFQALQVQRDSSDKLIEVCRTAWTYRLYIDCCRICYCIANMLKPLYVMRINTCRRTSRTPSWTSKMLADLGERCSNS